MEYNSHNRLTFEIRVLHILIFSYVFCQLVRSNAHYESAPDDHQHGQRKNLADQIHHPLKKIFVSEIHCSNEQLLSKIKR